MSRVLIAGGAGFIGSNLAKRLTASGIAVDCVDNLITSRPDNLRDLLPLANFRFIKGDITDPRIQARLIRQTYAEVYHLACPTGVRNIATLGEAMLAASSIGTQHLLKIARRSKARFLFASSAEAYGDPEVFPQSELYAGNVDPTGPRSAYEEGKRFGEAMTVFYARRFGVDARIARIFNTYGPAMSPRDSRVIPQMLGRMISGQPVVIYGDGSQTRTFLHIDDLLNGFEAVMQRGARGEVYNIGGEVETTILELFNLAKSVTGYDAPPVFESHFILDHGRRRPDTTKTRALGWRPHVPIVAGLKESHVYMRDLADLARYFAPAKDGTRRQTRGRVRPATEGAPGGARLSGVRAG